MEYSAIKRNEVINLGAPLGNEAERGYILHYFIYTITHEIAIRDGEQTSGCQGLGVQGEESVWI